MNSDDNSDDSLKYSDTDDTNNSASLRKPINKQNAKTKSTKKEVSFLPSVKQKEKRKAISQSSSTSNTNQDTKMDEMMNQFKNMTLMLQEMMQTNLKSVATNAYTRNSICRNCHLPGHDAAFCTKSCKVCKGTEGTHVFWKCPKYTFPRGQVDLNQQQDSVQKIEHALFEDAYSIEDLYVNEEILNNDERHANKRVRVEDLDEEEDEVQFV